MTHQRPTGWPALYLLLAVTALSQACREVGTAPDTPGAAQLSQAGAIDRPFTGACEVLLQEEQLSGGQVQLTGQGTCELTHLGRSAYRIVQTGDPSAGSFTGTAVFTAANGDELHGTFTGPSAGTGIVTLTGGTGRFRSATGSAGFARGPGKRNGPGAPGLADRYDGTLRFDPSGKEPAGEEPVRFTLEPGSAVTRTVDIEGGTITARSAAGVEYALVIPTGALMSPTAITLTPIAGASHYPTSGGFGAGVDFAPTGLRFAQVAHLRITLPTRPAGLQLIVTGYDADPAALSPLLTTDDGTVLDVPVVHFSGVTAGFGTTADLLAFPNPGPTTQSEYYLTALAQVIGSTTLTDPEKEAAYRQLLVAWITGVIQPLIAAANTDPQLLLAVGEFDRWHNAALALGVVNDLASDIAITKDMLAVKLLAAVDGNADQCGAQQSLAALYNVGFWYLQAKQHQLATDAHFLSAFDVQQTIAARCLTVELESDTLVNPMTVGTPYTLSLVWGVRFVGQPDLQGVPLKVGVLPVSQNLTIASPTGLSDVAGLYQTVITATADGIAEFLAEACLPMPGISLPPPALGCGDLTVGADEIVQRTAVSPITIAVAPSSVTLAPGATQQFDATVTGTGNTAVTWTATGGTITAGGFYTAGAVPGSYTVRATSEADPTLSAVAQVTIRSAFTGSLKLEAVENPGLGVQPCSITLPVPADLSGTADADAADVSGSFAGQFWCLSGAPTVTGTLAITITRRPFPGGFDATFTLKFLSFTNPIDWEPLVGCEYAMTGQTLSAATGTTGGSIQAWLAPTSCSFSNLLISVTFSP